MKNWFIVLIGVLFVGSLFGIAGSLISSPSVKIVKDIPVESVSDDAKSLDLDIEGIKYDVSCS